MSLQDDHANDASGATRLALSSALGGVIEAAGDEDWFRLEENERRHLKLHTTGSLDTVGTLSDESERQLAEDDDSDSGNNFALDAVVPAGVYFVRVRGYAHSETGSYTIPARRSGGRRPAAAPDAERTAYQPIPTSLRAVRARKSTADTTGTISLVPLLPLPVSVGRALKSLRESPTASL